MIAKNLFKLSLALFLFAAPAFAADDFEYDETTSSVAPVPPAERDLQTVTATPVAIVGDRGQTLEGALFAENGDLLFCDVTDRKVLLLAPDGKTKTLLELAEIAPGGLAFAPDGSLYVAGIDQPSRTGGIFAFTPDGKNKRVVVAPDKGFMPNDLVFAKDGGFYFTDFRGSATRPEGGVYYVAPDLKTITPVIPNMAQANGVALSPDGKVLWATEYARNLLHRVELQNPTSAPLTGSKIVYRFIGPAPDSMRTDADGNVYVALMSQGRVLIFNPNGFPIGQILLPDRDKGLNLRSSSLALHPKNRETRIVAGNVAAAPSKNATIFAAPAFAPATPGAKN